MPRLLALLLALSLPAAAAPGLSGGPAPAGFLYQLQGLDVDAAAASPFSLLVTDPSRDGTAEGALSPAEVEKLRAGGSRVVLAYLSIGEAEDYRPYWQPGWRPGSPPWLGPENPRWKGNYEVRYWDPAWQALLFGSPDAALDGILARGFDGVYLDIVDAYEFWGPEGRNERPGAARDMADLVLALAGYARTRHPGFLVFPQNAPELGARFPDYLAAVDGIGAEDTWFSGNRRRGRAADAVTAWLDLFRDAGKPVLAVDYPTRRRKIDAFFARAEARGYVPYRGPRELDRMVLDPVHPPAGGPRAEILAPGDGADLEPDPAPAFRWTARDGAVAFRLSFTGDDSYRRVLDVPRGKRFLAETNFTPSRRLWRRFRRLARRHEAGEVHWWVTARDEEGRLRTTRARSFRAGP